MNSKPLLLTSKKWGCSFLQHPVFNAVLRVVSNACCKARLRLSLAPLSVPGLQGLGVPQHSAWPWDKGCMPGRGCCAHLPRAGKTGLPSFPCETAAPSLGPLAAELVPAKVAGRQEFHCLKDAKLAFHGG